MAPYRTPWALMIGAMKIDGTSCTIAIGPAAVAPPRSYA